jgi:hypothetical protein
MRLNKFILFLRESALRECRDAGQHHVNTTALPKSI